MKKTSEKMKWLLANTPDGKIIEKYEDRYTVEVVKRIAGDYCKFRLYETADGEWMVTEK